MTTYVDKAVTEVVAESSNSSEKEGEKDERWERDDRRRSERARDCALAQRTSAEGFDD